jgi:nucleoside-diphosphate-sugar epimerase
MKGDLGNKEDVRRFLIEGAVLINLAYLKDPEQNLTATANLIGEARSIGLKRIVHCSTATVAGDVSVSEVDESTRARPSSDYERVKKRIEDSYLEADWLGGGVAILRPTAVFGEGGLNPNKILRDLGRSRWEAALRLSFFHARTLNLVSVENVVGAILFLAGKKEGPSGSIFIVSDDDAPSNNYAGVAHRFFLKRGERMPPYVPLPTALLKELLRVAGRSNSDPIRKYSSAKLRAAGWKPAVEFEVALDLYIDWFISHPSDRMALENT